MSHSQPVRETVFAAAMFIAAWYIFGDTPNLAASAAAKSVPIFLFAANCLFNTRVRRRIRIIFFSPTTLVQQWCLQIVWSFLYSLWSSGYCTSAQRRVSRVLVYNRPGVVSQRACGCCYRYVTTLNRGSCSNPAWSRYSARLLRARRSRRHGLCLHQCFSQGSQRYSHKDRRRCIYLWNLGRLLAYRRALRNSE